MLPSSQKKLFSFEKGFLFLQNSYFCKKIIMNIILIGSGGREHAMAAKIRKSRLTDKLFIIPGNAGTAELGENIPIDPSDFQQLANFATEQGVEMIIPGSEKQLTEGIHDFFSDNEKTKHIKIIGPRKAGALLESSKSFSKIFMQKYNIPTARSISITKKNIEAGFLFLNEVSPPYVLKADGPAAGKGVLILDNLYDAQQSLKEMLAGKFGQASEKVVLEEFMEGIELSVFIFTDGNQYIILPEAKDYKRIGEHDTGLNTGGMGAVSPVPFANADFKNKIEEQIIKPTLKGLQAENIPYIGFIFFGLMNTDGNPKVIEYNVRMGDPESEVVFPRILSDIVAMYDAATTKSLDRYFLETNPQTATTIMLVSGGYPEHFEIGKEIKELDKISESIAFHAGTQETNGRIYTHGGRVLALTSFADTLEEALNKSLRSAQIIDFEGKYFRRDIGLDLK